MQPLKTTTTKDFGTKTVIGDFDDYSIITKFGRNEDIDTGPEDVFAGGGEYTGQNATENENMQLVSSSTADVGTLQDSGTATGGTTKTLIDNGADFVNDGVTVGDVLINDTESAHGVITAVSATTITVFNMVGNGLDDVTNNSGDTYRIASTSGTGAALVRVEQILDEDYAEQPFQYVIPNGTTNVNTSINIVRATRAKVILAGSGGGNVGTITIRQQTTTANVFVALPAGNNQTTIAAYTVPAGKKVVLKRIRGGITRANGSQGSATLTLLVRQKGEVFRGVRVFEVQTGAEVGFEQIGGDVYPAGTDMKMRVEQVSDANTIVDGAFEFYLINN